MFRRIAVVLCLIVASIVAKNFHSSNLRAKIVTVDNLDQYLKKHPKMKPLQELTKVDDLSSKTMSDVAFKRGKRSAGKFEKSF